MGTLGDELCRLRRGRGVMSSDLLDRTGLTLRTLSGIADAPSENEARRRLVTYLCDLADELPEDLRLAFRVGLALHEDVQYRFLEERMQFGWPRNWTGTCVRPGGGSTRRSGRPRPCAPFRCHPTTATRLTAGTWSASARCSTWTAPSRPPSRNVRWSPGTTLFPRSSSRPASRARRALTASGTTADLTILYGGSLARIERPSNTYFRYFVRLPQPLRRGAVS